jgi:glycosyltransferase involved in cell wall biosynthesis
MRVLQLSEDFYPETSGGAFEDWEASKGMAKEDHDVTVVTPRRDDTPEREGRSGVDIRRPYRAETEGRDVLSPLGIVQRLKFVVLVTFYTLELSASERFDVIYVTNHILHPVGWVVSVRHDIPVISLIAYSPSNAEEARRLTNPFYLLEQMNIRFFIGDVVLCRTPVVRDMVARNTTSEVRLVEGILQTEVLRRAVDAPPADDFPDTRNVLLYVGRLDSNKNPIGAVDVVAELPSYHLVVIGAGPMRPALEAETEARGLSERVSFLGRCPHVVTLSSIHAASALVLTSRNEAYPTVVFESLALRTPVVATPVGVLPETDHPQLTLSPVEGMARVIRDLEIDPQAGIDEETLERFSIQRFVTDVLWALETATHGPTGSS